MEISRQACITRFIWREARGRVLRFALDVSLRALLKKRLYTGYLPPKICPRK